MKRLFCQWVGRKLGVFWARLSLQLEMTAMMKTLVRGSVLQSSIQK